MGQAIREEFAGTSQTADPRVFVARQAIDATTVGALRIELDEHLEAQGPEIGIDLAEVDFIDSTGLGLLVNLLRNARDRGGSVRLLNATRPVRRILQITGLEVIFEIPPGGE